VGQWDSGAVGQWDSGAVGQWDSGTVGRVVVLPLTITINY